MGFNGPQILSFCYPSMKQCWIAKISSLLSQFCLFKVYVWKYLGLLSHSRFHKNMIIHKVMRISKLQTHCDHSSLKISYFRPNFLQINCCYKCSMIFCVLKLLLHWEICPRPFVWFCRRANKSKVANGKSDSIFPHYEQRTAVFLAD